MRRPPFASADERNELVARIAEVSLRHHKAMDAGDFANGQSLRRQMRALIDEYHERLALRAICCCPYDAAPLFYRMDSWGLDGKWWKPDGLREHPLPCRHFCTLRGAINFGGKTPRGGDFDAQTGPEVPYVIPRLLEFDTMLAVVAKVPLPFGDAYTIGYFAERRPPVQQLAANWPSKQHTYTTAMGRAEFSFDNDPWDFDLDKWIAAGKLLWCPPDNPADAPLKGAPQDYPYRQLQGVRERMIVSSAGVFPAGLPDGSYISPYED
ncbi:MAG: hypothetical protein ABSH20_14885 [Tepidisphaeraceae bacterium]